MMSPFLGLSLVLHLLICFTYETAIFFRGLFFGFKKYANKRTMILVRNHEERVLPAMIIGIVVTFIGGIAVFSVETSYQNKPNTFDIIASAMDTAQINEMPKVKELLIPKEVVPNKQYSPPQKTEKTMIAGDSL